eukprot:TRINITY_DN67349_c5_g1_i7.p1 TRINITY_DN67349_c5_g1~~TRINITY_DN67349_c5_g1_i7.p1  ORF type:complete len:228 (+),score=11.22 TRINITY_DN67349_c5_g1_i7:46-729(+)
MQSSHRYSQEEMCKRKLCGLLSKLTPEKFDQILPEVTSLTNENAAPLAQLIASKVPHEPMFATMYVTLCLKVHEAEKAQNGTTKFRRALLECLQCAFEDADTSTECCDDADADYFSQKQISLKRGLVIFIAELFKAKFVATPTIQQVVNKLLEGESVDANGDRTTIPTEHNLETLLKCLQIVGPRLSKLSWFESTCEHLQFLQTSAGSPYCTRIRFMLHDFLESVNK